MDVNLVIWEESSSGGGTRTPDLVVNSHSLYQLSYSGTPRLSAGMCRDQPERKVPHKNPANQVFARLPARAWLEGKVSHAGRYLRPHATTSI